VTKLKADLDAVKADLKQFQSGDDMTMDTENLLDMIMEIEQSRAEIERLRDGLVNAGRQLAATEDHWQARVETLQQQRAELILTIARLKEQLGGDKAS
jgi:predicted  nucleic acid-binding Zn-ribbon protein